jgi:hypothetical protein
VVEPEAEVTVDKHLQQPVVVQTLVVVVVADLQVTAISTTVETADQVLSLFLYQQQATQV